MIYIFIFNFMFWCRCRCCCRCRFSSVAKLDGVKTYMRMRRVPNHLQVKVIKWFDYLWLSQKCSDEERAVSCLPDKLKVWECVYTYVYLFTGGICLYVCLCVRPYVCLSIYLSIFTNKFSSDNHCTATLTRLYTLRWPQVYPHHTQCICTMYARKNCL